MVSMLRRHMSKVVFLGLSECRQENSWVELYRRSWGWEERGEQGRI